MNTTKTLAAALCAVSVPALVAFRPTAQKITFAPAEGTTLTKVFTSEMQFAMDDMEMLMNGEENPMMPQIQMDMDMVQTISVTDTYGAMAGGKPAKVSRSYNGISAEIQVDMEMEGMGQSDSQSSTGSGSSPLEGETVHFTHADGEYTKAFDEDSEADVELLENLVEDMDLRALLPDGEVSEGDSWDIPLENLVDILAPGGDLALEMEMDDGGAGMGAGPDPTMMANVREMFGDMLEGKATGTYVGNREVDGISMAVIELAVEIDTAQDMSEFLEEMMAEQMQEEVEMTLERVQVEFALETSGELLWNAAAGHVHSMSIEGESAVAMDMEMTVDAMGQQFTIEMSMEMSGTLKNSVATE